MVPLRQCKPTWKWCALQKSRCSHITNIVVKQNNAIFQHGGFFISENFAVSLILVFLYRIWHNCIHSNLKYHDSDSEMHFYPKEFLSICLKLRTCFRDVWNRDELNKTVFQTGPTWRRNQVIPVISWLTKMQLHISTLFTLWKWYALCDMSLCTAKRDIN